MKIHEYNEMMSYLTRRPMSMGGRVGFAKGTEFGSNISEYKSKGNLLGYNVRSRKENIEKTFSKNQYGSLREALEAAKKYREETLKSYITNEQYLKLRNQNKEMSAKEFAEYLEKETTFKPRRGDKFTRDGIKNRDREVKFETTRAFTKRTLAPKIEEEIYQKYLKAVKEGKREGTIIGLGRKYLPGLTRGQQEKTISRILKEKGVDLSPFKKVGTGEKAAKQVVRKERLGAAKKLAGSSAGQLSDEIILDIKAMNKKVADMSVNNIANNKKYINSMRINATMDNLSKGVIPFDKYKDLSDLELANKIKDRAKANKFFDVEHISSVRGQKRNIYYPNNIQMAPGQFGSLMDNFKRIADEQPNNPVLSKVDEVLSEYNLTVRNPETKVRLGNKSVIEVTDGTSNIVKSNFKAVNTPFEKQTVTKPTPLKKEFKPGMQSDGRLVDLPGGNEKGFLGGSKAAKGVLKALQVLGQPSIAAGIAADELAEGNIKTAGASLLAPELVGSAAPKGTSLLSRAGRFAMNPFGRAARAFTPVGLATIGAGGLYDVYKEFERRQALTDEERLDEDLEAQEKYDEMMVGAADGGLITGRMGFANGPDDPSRRKFIKIMGGLASLPIVGKYFKFAEKAAPVVQQLKNTTTTMPEWFPSFIDKVIAKGVGKKVDADLTDIEVPELPGVKIQRHDDGRIFVEGQNEYGKPYAIEYEPPGYEVVDYTTGKTVKTKGDFRAQEEVPVNVDPDGNADFDAEVLDNVDNILGSDVRVMEEFATGKKIKEMKRGEYQVGAAEARAEQAIEELDISDYYED